MGGKKWEAPKGSWAYWRGSRQPRSPQASSAFPAYDRRDSRRGYWEREHDEPAEEATFAQVLQSSLNGTRKTEQKVIAINSAIAKRKEMWDLYVRDMKAAFKKEETRFNREMERLRSDLTKASQSQEEARVALLRVAADAATFGSAGSAGDVAMGNSGVDQIFDSWRADGDDFDARALLQRALEANSAARPAGPPPGLAAPHGPDLQATMTARAMQHQFFGEGHPGGAPTGPVEATSGPVTHTAPSGDAGGGSTAYASGVAAREPYLTSPGHPGGRTHGPAVSPSARDSPYPEPSGLPGAALDPVAARLAANRAANPFGEGTHEPLFGALRSNDPARRPVPTLIEDDDELLSPPDPGQLESLMLWVAGPSLVFMPRFWLLGDQSALSSLAGCFLPYVFAMDALRILRSCGLVAEAISLTFRGLHRGSALRDHQLTRMQVQSLIWHDVEDVEIWVDDAEFPASHGTLAFSNGSVFTVLLPGHGPPFTYPVGDILRADAVWGPFEHTPKPYRTVGDAVVSPYEVFCLRWQMLSPLSLESCVRKSLRLAVDSSIQHTFGQMQLDVHGDYCRSVYVEADCGTPWLIDARAVGAPLRVHNGDCAPDATQVRDSLPFALPPDYDIVMTLDKRHYDAGYLRVVFVDVVVVEADEAGALPTFSAWPAIESKGPSEGTTALAQAVASMEAQGITGFLPQPLQRLGAVPPREDHDPDVESGESGADSHDDACRPTFCVLSPDVVPEIVQLTIDFPCTVDNALRELADAIDASRYRFFPRLLEVRPQPSQFWALAVALPPWTRMEPVVVFNLTRLDGRCFAAPLVSPFRSCHVLAAVGFAEDSDVDIFAFMRFRPMDPEQECEVIEGGTITIRRSGSAHTVQGHSLDVMLRSSIGWEPEPDIPQPPSARRVCVVQENAFGFTTIDEASAPEEEGTMRALGLRADNVHFALGTPELPDVLCKGLPCGSVLAYIAADAGTIALPAPPRVVILDCRPVLQGLTLWVSPTGSIPYWELTNWAEVFCPPDWQAQILGAPIEAGSLQVENGCVLTVEFVPVTSPEPNPDGAPGEARMLQEPVTAAGASQVAMDNLREITLQLGFDWMRAPFRWIGAPPVQDSDDPPIGDEEGEDAEVMQVHFLVLAPLLPPESSSVLIEIPATLFEFEAAIQLKRDAPLKDWFPHLCNVVPQPLPGRALFVALPHWNPMHNIVCFNTADIDGRLFSAPAPVYADLQELKWLAQIPDAVDCVLYVGLDDQPLRSDARASLFPGVQLRFAYDHRPEPEPAFLPELLLSRSFWAAVAAVRGPNLRHAYCLATDAWHRLHVDDFSQPFRFRQHVAACLGVDANSFQLCPSRPALTNVEVDGVVCNTVLAVARHRCVTAPPTVTVLLDCRPILGGLRSHQVDAGPLNADNLCCLLQHDAPPGQTVQLREARSHTEESVVPGQVITVEYVECPEAFGPLLVSGATPHAASVPELSQDTPDTGGTGGDPTPNPDSPAGAGDSLDGLSEDAGDPDGASSQAVSATDASDTSFVAVILCPDYKPEVCAVTAPLPTSLLLAVASVNADREEIRWFRFPTIIPVFPQPDWDRAYFVARPVQPTGTVFVSFDLRPVDGRMFAIDVPNRLSREDIITIARLNGQPFLQVYVRDMPWALDDDFPITLSDGDLISISPPASAYTYLVSLEDRLQDPRGWEASTGFLDEVPPFFTVFGDEDSVRIPALPHRQPFLRHDIVLALQLGAAPLDICPAAPGIYDYASRGCSACAVLVATTALQDWPTADPADCVYFLDQRPLLLGLIWGIAREGIVDVAAIRGRLILHCPPGYELSIRGGRRHGSHNRFRLIQAGEVLTAEMYLTGFFPPNVIFPDPDEGSCARVAFGSLAHAPTCLLWSDFLLFVSPQFCKRGTLKTFLCSGDWPPWIEVAAERPSAFVAECLALIAASLLCTTTFHEVPVSICVDCTAALGIAAGDIAGHGCGVAGILRRVSYFLRAVAVHPPRYHHVAGHTGCFANEVADVFAKLAARGCIVVKIIWVIRACLRWARSFHCWSHADSAHSLSFERADFLVLHQDPRRLFVLFSKAGVNLLFVSAHAPHKGAESHLIERWWAETRRLLDNFARRAPLLFMGDFNAAVGSVRSAAVGPLYQDQQDQAGDLLHDLVLTHSLWVPSTFEGVHRGPGGTYVQKRNGQESRLDFICPPESRSHSQVASWSDPSIHAGQPIIDHIAALVSVDLLMPFSRASHKGKPFSFDAAALLTASGKEEFRRILSEAPRVDWAVGPDAHAAIIVGYLQRSLQASFPKPKCVKRHAYLSDETWSLHMQVKRHDGGRRDAAIVTTKGSRPGSSWADLFFGVTIPGIVGLRDSLRAQCRRSCGSITIPWDGERTFFPLSTTSACCDAILDDVVWADDMASFLQITSPAEIASRLGYEASTLVEAFAGFGYCLSFGEYKTAAIDRSLLSSHVVSRLSFGCGAWGLMRVGEYRAFAGALLSMYRQCLCVPHGDPQDFSCATICALLQQHDPWTLLRLNRLRYARQLVATGPDILWALLKADSAFVESMQDAFQWMHRWLVNTTALACPATHWEAWATVLSTRPTYFKGLVKRAGALEGVRVSCYAALQALRKALCLIAGCRDPSDAASPQRPTRYTDACLICKVAFPTRATWAVHAARKHGYRAPATLFAGESVKPLCLGCGKLYANKGRLRRHLLSSTVCRVTWGSFQVAGDVPDGTHIQLPPVQLQGSNVEVPCREDPVCTRQGLVDALLALDDPGGDSVWDTVLEFVEPIAVLKQSLRTWACHTEAPPHARELADDAVLMLDPELWCDDFRVSKSGASTPVACADLVSPSLCRITCPKGGPFARFELSPPPIPEFVYPFWCSLPLRAAKEQWAWLEHACDTVGAFLQSSTRTPSFLATSSTAWRCLAPVSSWILDCGFAHSSEGVGSPP
ncbi:hypothetical protein AK812_SmicGene17930 [Symbiodinium microadriaticum]|uniref:RNase H type-1 domain-containing protein n=1 Tax=Symbiodinium microadriaticum TaxID=2951 RepID=A0A1Q9DWE0_SYMMI|nr:hypothetical protein AK812_SmicGene17930 [Symbiodinium microadriaticum]